MAKKKRPDEKKPIVDEVEKQKQIELQKQAEEERLRKEKEREERERIEKEKNPLLSSILEQTEAKTPKQKKAKNFEDEKLKTQLIGGSTVQQEIDRIAQYKQPYIPYFSFQKNNFYKDTYNLKQWTDDYKKFFKVKEMADITTNLIYGRFNKEVLPRLREKNPYIGYLIRKYKLFQFLTAEAQKELESFIADYVQMIQNYDNWDIFEKDYCEKYKLPRQSKLF